MGIQQIMEWCDSIAKSGQELSLEWSGGFDEGWVHVNVDGHPSTDPEAERIEELLEEEVGYPWWLGESSAWGDAEYDPATQTFDGTYWEEDVEDTALDCDIAIRVPSSVDFDCLGIETEGIPIEVDPGLFKGDRSVDAIQEAEQQKLHDSLLQSFRATIENSGRAEEVHDTYHEYEIPRAEFERDGDDLLHHLREIFVTMEKPRTIQIDLRKLLAGGEEDPSGQHD